jgi:hypothetical protein
MDRFKFVFAVLCVSFLMVFTVYLRSRCDQLFHEFSRVTTEQNRLKQQLWHKQLQLESRLNPTAVKSYESP